MAIGLLTLPALLSGNLTGVASPTTPRQSGYPGGSWQPPAAAHAVSSGEDVSLPMDDGVTIRASVFYPVDRSTQQKSPGSFPVVIEITPYVGQSTAQTAYFVERGYIYVLARPRGSAGSGGEVQQFNSRDGRDGRAVAEWAAHQLAGSDGNVALIGCSYPGATALATAAQMGADSPVKAVIASCIGLDMQHRQVWTTNGMPNAALAAFQGRAAALMGNSAAAGQYFDQFAAGVLAGGPEAYDGYWQDRLPLAWAQRIADSRIPVLLWVGWDDINEMGAIHAYTALQNAASGRPFYGPMAENTPVTARYQMIVGDWGHGGGLDLGVQLQWFETWLRNADTGMQRTSMPMHLFEKGTNRWVNVARYPLVREYATWYFDTSEALSPAPPRADHETTLRWTTPDQPNGRVQFETPPFAEGATLAGPMSATVYARSSNTNMVIIGKLYDVAPDGTATRISMGGLLGSQRRLNQDWSWVDGRGAIIRPWPALERDEFLTPNQVYRMDVPLATRQWGVRQGHRVRLELTTQSPPDICPTSGPAGLVSEPCRLTAPQQATVPGGIYTIVSGPNTPSALHLPQLPRDANPSVPGGRSPTAPEGRGAPPPTLPLDWGG